MKHINNLVYIAATCAVFLGVANAAVAPAHSFPGARQAVDAEQVTSYDGYKVVRLPTGADLDKVTGILSSLELETWKITHAFADVMVPPEKLEAFNTETAGLTGSKKTLYEDLGVSVETERKQLFANTALTARQAVDDSWFSAYHPYNDHLQFLNNLVAQFPDNAEIVTSGTSTDNRNITGIHIFGSSGGGVNPAIVFHGTVHAREWITTAGVEYNAYSLLTNYSTDPQTQGWVDKYDFYLFPVVNPDGFVYSQTNDRLWRKNRQRRSGISCVGTDINRNWPYQWSIPGGSDTNPCGQAYRGQAAGDSTEMTGLIAKLAEIQAQQGLKLYIDWHSYSQLFMSPYGYDCNVLASNNDELQSLSQGVVAAIAKPFGTPYQSGPVCSTIYQVSGGSVDYVFDVTEAQYVFTVELRDTGENGFILPAEEILPTSLEAFEGVKYLLDNIA